MSNTHQPASPNGLQVLFTDDEEYLRELMELEIPRMGHAITVCPDGANAVHMLEQNNFDCLLVDLDMPGMNGMEVIARAKELSPELDCIILTGKSSIESAIAALRHGVFDYITKPCKLIELKSILQRVADKRQLRRNYQAVKRQLDQVQGTSQLIGETPVMAQLKSLISRVAPTDSTVLIRGETGSGKELVARSIHQESTRAEMPFVAVNCGALRKTSSKVNYSVIAKAHSPGLINNGQAYLKLPMVARCFWTKSVSCPKQCKPIFSGYSRAVKYDVSAITKPLMSMFGWYVQLIEILNIWWLKGIFVKISCFE